MKFISGKAFLIFIFPFAQLSSAATLGKRTAHRGVCVPYPQKTFYCLCHHSMGLLILSRHALLTLACVPMSSTRGL
ncbi:hypothetical protein BDV23DRAFT_167134 [Aspergillus alliaceus]|uniref:Secreted protein n=1 Tax=Petromyces alliaceus TaxID=209559 RepID=A0A5N7BRL4_PETAA|nr:hypothetical protein BDV23DRAFT_167134 [Aspergillus alliaceus]